MTSQSRYTARIAQKYSPNRELCETCARDAAKCRGNTQLLFFSRVETKDIMTAQVSTSPKVQEAQQRSILLPPRRFLVPEGILGPILFLHQGTMSIDDTCDRDRRVDRISDGIINVATSGDRSSSSDAVNNTIVFACLTNLAANSLRLAVLSESSRSGEVTKTVDALELFITMGWRLQVLDECRGGLNRLAIVC
jgi:hypothetical protein